MIPIHKNYANLSLNPMARFARINYLIFSVAFFSLSLFSCASKPTPTPVPRFDVWLESPSLDITQIIVTSTIQPTPMKSKVLFVSDDTDENHRKLQTLFQELSVEKGFDLEVIRHLEEKDIGDEVVLVVGFSKDELEPFISNYPDTRFVYIGSDQTFENNHLIRVPFQTTETEKMDFLAGYIAAIIADNWRVGMVSDGKENTEKAFSNGFRYFCGLCRPAYPPFVQYPIVVQNAGESIDSIASKLQENAVKIVYLGGEAINNIELIKSLAEKGIRFISTTQPPAEVRDYWIVTINHIEINEIIKENIDQWVFGGGKIQSLELHPFLNTDENLFSLGKQKLAEKCYEELILGLIEVLGEY